MVSCIGLVLLSLPTHTHTSVGRDKTYLERARTAGLIWEQFASYKQPTDEELWGIIGSLYTCAGFLNKKMCFTDALVASE